MKAFKTIWIPVLSSLVLVGSACKKDDDRVESAEKAVESARENVKDQREDLREEAKDMREEAKDLGGARQDVAQQQRELSAAQTDLAQARARYSAELKTRLATIDNRIAQLRAKGDAKSRAAADRLQTRRNELAVRVDNAANTADANWEQFKKDTSDAFNSIEKDIDDAL